MFWFFAKLIAETGGTFKSEVHDILANDEHGAVVVTNTAERKGKRLEWRAVNITDNDRQGRLTEFWTLPENSQEMDEFFS